MFPNTSFYKIPVVNLISVLEAQASSLKESLRSNKINCDSIKLHSSRTEEIHLSQYRMEIIEQNLEEKKININSTIFVKSNIDSEPISLPASTSLLERIKWPLIGSLAAITFLIFLGLIVICLLKNHSNSGVSVTITNAATSNNDSPICNESVVTPSCPTAIQIQGNDPVQEAPPAYYSTVDINRLLDIPIANRNAFETRAVLRHMAEMQEKSLPLPQV